MSYKCFMKKKNCFIIHNHMRPVCEIGFSLEVYSIKICCSYIGSYLWDKTYGSLFNQGGYAKSYRKKCRFYINCWKPRYSSRKGFGLPTLLPKKVKLDIRITQINLLADTILYVSNATALKETKINISIKFAEITVFCTIIY